GNPNILPIVCDVTSRREVEAAKDLILERFGKIDAVVNNAGWLPAGRTPFEAFEMDQWQKCMELNVNGTFIVTQVMGRAMIAAGKGAFVNLASIASFNPIPGSGSYCPSKAAVAMITRQIALEWGKYGIRANAICPGQIVTELTKHRFTDPEITRMKTAVIPLGRLGNPKDIAKACYFLTSDEADYITGETLLVDGGMCVNTFEVLGKS
ncbi:SDR family oxidoreductase, partial [Desulfovibrio sp. OttesenSCG-928-C14]|nr:SDR family oxidoreductase [Desulfovibrio sp. OttesenSCG-928-C14]